MLKVDQRSDGVCVCWLTKVLEGGPARFRRPGTGTTLIRRGVCTGCVAEVLQVRPARFGRLGTETVLIRVRRRRD